MKSREVVHDFEMCVDFIHDVEKAGRCLYRVNESGPFFAMDLFSR